MKAYLDENGKLVTVGYEPIRTACWVDEGRAIPEAWQELRAASSLAAIEAALVRLIALENNAANLARWEQLQREVSG